MKKIISSIFLVFSIIVFLSSCNHSHVAGDPVKENEVAATCTEEGSYDKVIYCKGCNKVMFKDHKIIEPLGHTYGEWETTKEAGCEEKGSKHRICSRCNYEDTKEIEALEHSFGEWETTKTAKCEEKGSEHRICSRCNYEDTKEIEALGHTYGEWETTKPASCTEEGSEHRICGRCNHEETRAIDKLDHNFVKKTDITYNIEYDECVDCKTCSNFKSIEDYDILIYTEEDFLNISNDLTKKYKLANDIVLTESTYNFSVFSGVLDGDFHTIYNVGKALFGRNDGTIKNLNIVNDELKKMTSSICYKNNGNVLNCSFTGDLSYDGMSYVYVGGLVAINTGLVENCYYKGNVSGICQSTTGYSPAVGGIVGQNNDDEEVDAGIIRYCYSIANVYAEGNYCGGKAGGIVGRNYYGSIEISHCYFSGTITAIQHITNDHYIASGGFISSGYSGSTTYGYYCNSSITIVNGEERDKQTECESIDECVTKAFGDTLLSKMPRDKDGNPVFKN